MSLTLEERIEVILISGERSSRVIAADFNNRHPDRPPVSHSTVAALLSKFRATGSVADKPRSGRPKTATDEATSTAVVAAFAKSPRRSTRRLSAECGISQSSIVRILQNNNWHPYKLQLQQKLSEDDPDRRVEFCTWVLDRHAQDPSFAQGILFSDEANFYVNGEVNRQNLRYWSDQNPHWTAASKVVSDVKVMVWCGIWGSRVIGPIFISGNLNAQGYLEMLQDTVFPSLLTADGSFPCYFQQDGAPPHYGAAVRRYLDVQFPGHWIGRRGPVEWPPRSPDLTPLDFYLWGHLKQLVYAVKIRDIRHLHQRILEACDSISPDILIRVHHDWIRRLQLCVQQQGQHIEHIK